jgi:hypothetical protein
MGGGDEETNSMSFDFTRGRGCLTLEKHGVQLAGGQHEDVRHLLGMYDDEGQGVVPLLAHHHM